MARTKRAQIQNMTPAVPVYMTPNGEAASMAVPPPPPSDDEEEVETGPLLLEVKRVARRYDQKTGQYRDEEDVEVNKKSREGGLDARYAFAIIRQFSSPFCVTTFLAVRSPYFLEVAKIVMAPCRGLTWNTTPMSFPPKQVLSFLPRFKAHLAPIEHKLEDETATGDEVETVKHLQFFIRFLEEEYESTLNELAALLAEGKITFDLLWGILLPGIIVVHNCHLTGEPRAARLISAERIPASIHKPQHWSLKCEYVDFTQNLPSITELDLDILDYEGAVPITDLDVFPMEPFLPETARSELKAKLVARGKRYTELSIAWCHKRYSGIAYKPQDFRKIGIKSRIILDRILYDQYGGSSRQGRFSLDRQRLSAQAFKGKAEPRRVEPTDDELMLMPAILYGYSLADRKWLLFNVTLVEEIVWNPEAFEHLDISRDKKDIVRTLTESHARNAAAFDDFIEGKGIGLIFNLHGTPGVGKTMTAEATSEVARAPLYVVSAGDLGTTADALDAALTRIFALASAWRAVVLIDEADVFLEKRDLHDLIRNAMVAVFLRQLEYYPGILILTTNRVNIMDDAIKSRIHVSLHYNELGAAARKRLWQDFLKKAGMADEADEAMLQDLSERPFNGREIKNIVKVAVTFASYNGRAVTMADVVRVINADEDTA